MRERWAGWRNRQGQLWMNVASSHFTLSDFVNLDRSAWLALAPAYPLLRHVLRPAHAQAVRSVVQAKERTVLIRHDCTKPLPVPDGVVDHILCSHFLEHVPATGAERILSDFYRSLRPGASVHIVLPNLRYHTDRYLRGELDADGFVAATLLRSRQGDRPVVRIMEAVGGFGLRHQWMYDPVTAAGRVQAAGFLIVDVDTPSSAFRRDDPESLHVVGVKPTEAALPVG